MKIMLKIAIALLPLFGAGILYAKTADTSAASRDVGQGTPVQAAARRDAAQGKAAAGQINAAAQAAPDTATVVSWSDGGCIPVRDVSSGDSLAFIPGEKFSFTMHYEWGAINSDVGSANIVLDTVRLNGIKVFHTMVYGRTTKLYDIFFKVRENFQSWFTYDGLTPMRFTRDTYEGRYVARNQYQFRRGGILGDHIRADVYTSTSGDRYVELPLNGCTFDLPSLFFYARNIDYDRVEPNVKMPMTFAIDDDIYNVYFIMRGKEVKKVKGLGTVNTVKFSVKLLAGSIFTGEEDLTLWISDDENRIPVLFEAPILVGRASGRLKSYSGLKYPFSALQKK